MGESCIIVKSYGQAGVALLCIPHLETVCIALGMLFVAIAAMPWWCFEHNALGVGDWRCSDTV